MAKIKKSPEQRKSKHIRVPMTLEQHAQIQGLHGEIGMAEWARSVLLAQIAAEIADAAEQAKKGKTT